MVRKFIQAWTSRFYSVPPPEVQLVQLTPVLLGAVGPHFSFFIYQELLLELAHANVIHDIVQDLGLFQELLGGQRPNRGQVCGGHWEGDRCRVQMRS